MKSSWIVRWSKADRLNKYDLQWLYVNLLVTDHHIWEMNLNTRDINNLYLVSVTWESKFS